MGSNGWAEGCWGQEGVRAEAQVRTPAMLKGREEVQCVCSSGGQGDRLSDSQRPDHTKSSALV